MLKLQLSLYFDLHTHAHTYTHTYIHKHSPKTDISLSLTPTSSCVPRPIWCANIWLMWSSSRIMFLQIISNWPPRGPLKKTATDSWGGLLFSISVRNTEEHGLGVMGRITERGARLLTAFLVLAQLNQPKRQKVYWLHYTAMLPNLCSFFMFFSFSFFTWIFWFLVEIYVWFKLDLNFWRALRKIKLALL